MNRMDEMNEYDSMFGRRLVDDDFLAAGYTQQELQTYRGLIAQPSLTAQDRSEMEAKYGTLQEPDLTLRQRAASKVQDRLIRAGLDPYLAGSYGRRIMGDTAPTDGGQGMGLADFTPLGSVFGVQEGSRTASQGYQQGDPLQMGLGVLEAGLNIAGAAPLTSVIGRGIAKTASRMDPNTLYSVFGPPMGARSPLRAAETGGRAGIRAYQGTPHDFSAERLVRYPDGRTEYIVGSPDVFPDVPAGAEVLQDFPLGRMRMDKIGTGVGAQAQGSGLYFAENVPTARQYKEKWEDAPGSGRIYEVNIDASNSDFLDYDMPLAGQTPEIQERIRKIAPNAPGMATGERLLREINPTSVTPYTSAADRAAAETSEILRSQGIPGIRYQDPEAPGKRNFVVFDENLINIVKRYGIAGAAAMLGVTALDVEQALAENLPPSEWDRVLVGPQ